MLNHRVHIADATKVLKSAVPVRSCFRPWLVARLLGLLDLIHKWTEIPVDNLRDQIWVIVA